MSAPSQAELDAAIRRKGALLLASVFVVATCGLVYELIAGALSSYLVGSSVTQFSLVIGLFMSAMGLGSYLSRFVRKDPLSVFVAVEILVGLIGGLSPLWLFYAFTFFEMYTLYLVVSSVCIGTLVGLEIPLVIRVIREHDALAKVVSSVLAIDYAGALLASILFPLVLVPSLGLVRTGFAFGLLNVGVAAVALWKLGPELRHRRRMQSVALATALLLFAGLVSAGGLTRFAEDRLYQDEIVLARDSSYQRVVVTRWRSDLRLYLNGHLQFSTVDEARYHEPLVHPVMAAVPQARRVLILGGGDGMAVREVLRHPGVAHVDLVDLDPLVTELFRDRAMLRELNGGVFDDPRVQVHNTDAAKFLEHSSSTWDVAIVDLPDPSTPSLARLYARSFYRLLSKHLAPDGAFVTQATSPFFARRAFWCIASTIREADPTLRPLPYHVNVPSFGEWGFVLASKQAVRPRELVAGLPAGLRYLNADLLPRLFVFGNDMRPPEVEINHLDRPVLVRYYEQGWRRFNN